MLIEFWLGFFICFSIFSVFLIFIVYQVLLSNVMEEIFEIKVDVKKLKYRDEKQEQKILTA